MSVQQRNGQNAESERQRACDLWISRSRLGWLRIRFDSGPSYPEMVETLKDIVDQCGGLVRSGERISGAEWLRRIDQSDVRITKRQRQAIQILM